MTRIDIKYLRASVRHFFSPFRGLGGSTAMVRVTRTILLILLCASVRHTSAQTKTPIPSLMGIFYYKDSSVVLVFNTQRSIIAQMNQRHTRRKLDSVWLCERSFNVSNPVIKKKYYFKK